jgi:hypothetical protein
MLTALRWSPTLPAASLEQAPVHVKGGCAEEVDCDVTEGLQALGSKMLRFQSCKREAGKPVGWEGKYTA